MFRESILICDEFMPAAAGAFRGSLARLLAQKGLFEEAYDLLSTGASQVRTYRKYRQFLCNQGQVCHMAGDTDGARAARLQAQEMAIALKLSDDSKVGRALAALRTVLEGDIDEDGALMSTDVEQQELALLEAARLMELGDIEREEGRYDDALRCYRRALDIFRVHENQTGQGRALNGIAVVHEVQGHLAQAIVHYNQAIAIARQIGNKRLEGMHLGNLGGAYRAQGRLDLAIAHYSQALAISREIGDSRFEGIHLGNLGEVYLAQGEMDQAIAHHSEALAISREIGNKRFEGIHLGNMGLFYQAQGDLESAISHYRDAIAIARIIGNKRFEGIYLGNLGDSLFQIGRTHEAEIIFERPSLLVTRPFQWRLAPSRLFGLALGEAGPAR